MSKRLIIICLICINFSCDSEKTQNNSNAKVDIKGSWFMSKNKNQTYESYKEVLITEELIRYYDEDAGLRLPIRYTVKNDTLFFIFDNVKYNNGIINKIGDDFFMIKTPSNVLYMKKIKNGCKLDDFIFDNDSCYISDFHDRMLRWDRENKIIPTPEPEYESIEPDRSDL